MGPSVAMAGGGGDAGAGTKVQYSTVVNGREAFKRG